MPDSLLPPNWGPAPFDERDLDAVLSGETADISVALRPVADTLAALRAAATSAELRGEATIMAEFRALGPGEVSRPADPATTLQLPVLPADRPRRRAARRRGRRRAAPPVSRRAGALMGVAAAAVIVVAVVFAGNLSGPIQRLAHFGHLSTVSSSARPAGSNSASPGLQATGAATEPAASPTASRHAAPSPSQSESGRLCRAYYGYFEHLGTSANWSAEVSLFKELSKLAGSPFRVPSFCSPYLGDLFPHGVPEIGWHYPRLYPGNGSQGNQDQGSGSAQSGQGGSSGSGTGQGSQGSQGGSGPHS